MVRDLASFFGSEATVDAVVDERNKAVAAGYTDYVRKLYADAGLETIVFDFGMPMPNLPVDPVKAELPVEIVPVFRIEPLIAELLKTDIGWSEFKQRFDDACNDALTAGGFRGLKSIIAYRTGLEVSPLSRTVDQGFQALDAIRRGLGGGSMKKLRDHLLCRAIEMCMDHDVPMQIHTGMGDFEVNLVYCRPAFLMDLLRFPAYRACRVLLVHSGFPYHREAAYMANVLPRVYLDVSEGIPFAGNAARDIFTGTMAMAPLNKICYGSDGYALPEINYTSAKLGKQALKQALESTDRRWIPGRGRSAGGRGIDPGWKCAGALPAAVTGVGDMDQILLEGMIFYGYHGVNPEEQTLGQRFIVDVAIDADLREAGQSDDSRRRSAMRTCSRWCEQSSRTSASISSRHWPKRSSTSHPCVVRRAEGVTVTVRKPGVAIKGSILDSAGVRIHRDRDRTE